MKNEHRSLIKHRSILDAIMATSCLIMFSTHPASGQNILARYVEEGMNRNESIKQQQFLLEKNLYALKEARSLFFPEVSFQSTYTLAGGGRSIALPVGDLLNSAYKTLNQLTGSNSFPQVENRSIQLNPNNFYDMRIHTVYPIINAERDYNRRIKTDQVEMQKLEIAIYKRELAKEIKIAYYDYLRAREAVKIFENSLSLVKENARINTALFNNDKVNRTAVIRSNNEITKISSEINTAQQRMKNAQAYFNFLMNRSLENDIQIDSVNSVPIEEILHDTSISKREELLKLNTAKSINNNLIGLANSYRRPRLNSFLDLGSQGFDFRMDNKSSYYFFGVSLEMDLFAGGKNKHKVNEANAEKDALNAQANYVEQQLALQLRTTSNSYEAAVVAHRAAVSQVEASEKYYKDFLRMYKEGTALFIELLDAHNQLLQAQLKANITLYETWIKQAEIERANAALIIK